MDSSVPHFFLAMVSTTPYSNISSGPASRSEAVIEGILRNGMNVARLNYCWNMKQAWGMMQQCGSLLMKGCVKRAPKSY